VTARNDDATGEPIPARRRAVNLRSVLLGLVGVAFICGLTPYNDFVVNNTYLVGNFLPIGLLLFFLLVIMLVNAPLWRFAPRHALSSGELAVALGMTLVSCALPSSGLMRYLPAFLVGLQYHGIADAEFRRCISDLNLPAWIFPQFESPSDPVIQDYWGRVLPGEMIPWAAWVTPAIAWGILLAAMYGAVICISVIVRRQWVENERLPFPLASIYVSLVEEPQPGHGLNALFRSRGFWMALAAVFVMHSINALNLYWPKYVERIPLGFNMGAIFSEEPWRYTEWGFKSQTLYFSIIGITFFLQTKIAFSLWFFFIAVQVTRMLIVPQGWEITTGMQTDQLFGAVLVFAATVLWIGRNHWLLVMRHMLGRATADEPRGKYLPYSIAGWGLVGCWLAMAAWLVAAGASVAGAVVLVGMLMVLFMVIARVVAETGLIFVQFSLLPLWRPWTFLGTALPFGWRTTPQSFFYSAMFTGMLSHDMRETSSVYTTQSLKVADDTAYANDDSWRRSLAFVVALALALLTGYLISGASTLYVEYTHASTVDRLQATPINGYGVDAAPRYQVISPTRDYLSSAGGPNEAHSRLGHFTFGAALTAMLGVLRLRLAWWPLHPVGFLLVYSYPIMTIWFSIFVGWLAKVLIVKFGGIELFRAARNVFIGLIIGEAGTAAVWLVVSFVRLWLGLEYYSVRLLPG